MSGKTFDEIVEIIKKEGSEINILEDTIKEQKRNKSNDRDIAILETKLAIKKLNFFLIRAEELGGGFTYKINIEVPKK